MWAYLCGAVSAGVAPSGHWLVLILGVILAGPIVCGMSQAANDWCDRHVDAINEPDRPIPSGRIPGRWGLWIAIAMSVLAAFIGLALGPWGFGATLVAIAAAWAYSAEPMRLKRSGLWGPGLVGLSYETCRGSPAPPFWPPGRRPGPSSSSPSLRHRRAWDHDAQRLQGAGRRSPDGRQLPARHAWPRTAAKLACVVMAVPQLVVFPCSTSLGSPVAWPCHRHVADRAALRDAGPAA
jgi:chlorophyll synthase